MEEQVKRKGNPNFGRKPQPTTLGGFVIPDSVKESLSEEIKETFTPQPIMEATMQAPAKKAQEVKDIFDIDPNRKYWFQLTQTYERLKPRDSKTGLVGDNLYPPIKMAPNAGVAMWKGNRRRWRYIYDDPSVWVDEQINPVPTEQQIADPRNDLNFREGNLILHGSDKARVMALLIQDEFEGNEHSVSNVPKTYRLINESDALNVQAEAADKAFEAETAARQATIQQLLPIALLFGINIDDSANREEAIKKQVILKARQLPDVFLKNFVNPKVNIKYLVSKALTQNIISGATGQLVMVDTGRVLFNVDVNKDLSEQIANMVMANDEPASLLYRQLQTALS